MTHHTLQRRTPRLFSAVLAFALLVALAPVAGAQTPTVPPVLDPYTGGTIPGVPGAGAPRFSINVTVAVPGQRVRIQGCLFVPSTFVRITLNPGSNQNQGAPCTGAQRNALGGPQAAELAGTGGGRQLLSFEPLAQTATTPTTCPFNHAGDAAPPDTTAGGAIASTRAEGDGCVDTWVTLPRTLTPGAYELCAIPTGQTAACAALKIVSSTTDTSRGLARTGLMLLPWVLGAVAAIFIGRSLARRSQQSGT